MDCRNKAKRPTVNSAGKTLTQPGAYYPLGYRFLFLESQMTTHNGIQVPTTIRSNRIISAFCNPIDKYKVENYTERMLHQDGYLPDAIPAIMGYPDIVDQETIDKNLCFLNGDEVTDEHIGQMIWYVTDGHHRSIAANDAELPFLNVEVDPSTFTVEQDLIDRRQNRVNEMA